MTPERRLLFWLRISFLGDTALVAAAIWLLSTGNSAGWWLLVFTGLRAVLGAIALFWVAPSVLRRR